MTQFSIRCKTCGLIAMGSVTISVTMLNYLEGVAGKHIMANPGHKVYLKDANE